MKHKDLDQKNIFESVVGTFKILSTKPLKQARYFLCTQKICTGQCDQIGRISTLRAIVYFACVGNA
jgi:hypothetical protein